MGTSTSRTGGVPRRDDGFTLVELLVVIIVIGIIAAIAIPVFLNQRNKGYDAQVKSDLKNVAMVAESNYVSSSTGYATEDAFKETTEELASKGTEYVGYADADSYVVYGKSRSGRVFEVASESNGTPTVQDDTDELPAIDAAPPAGIVAPYAAVEWNRQLDGTFTRDSRFFDTAPGGSGGPGGGGIGAITELSMRYDLTMAGCTETYVTLPIRGPQSVTVDWGDGSPETTDISHGYDAPGSYVVTVSGSFTAFGTGGPYGGDSYGYASMNMVSSQACISEVLAFDATAHNTTSLRGAFSNAINLTSIGTFRTTGVTDMAYMFFDANSFNAPVPFDTSSVTNMSGMFSNDWGDPLRGSFNQPIDFDTSNVTDMSAMFYNANAFNSPVRFSDTSRVTTMGGMFSEARAFNQPLTFDTSNVTNMASMFATAAAFNQPLTFDTSNVTTMHGMFSQAVSFNSPLTFTDTSKVTSMHSMFFAAAAFDQDISGWDVSAVQSWDMFSVASPLSAAHSPF